MTIKGKRIFNYRPMCFFTLALVVGILIGEGLYGEHFAFYFIPIAAFVLSFCLICAFKKTRKLAYIPIAFIVGLSAISISNAVYDAHSFYEYDGTFSAKVASEIIVKDGKTTFYVSDISADGFELKYDCYVIISGEIAVDFGAGDTVILTGKLNPDVHAKFDTYFASNRAKGLGYYAFVSEVEKASDGRPSFPLNLQIAIKRLLFENTDEHTASVCQALVLGDKRGMDGGLYDNVKASGLAHVLAVSGLHISTLATAVYFLLKKLKVNPKASFFIVLSLTFFYSMLCSFTASSLRAFVMSGVYMFASSFGQKRDDMSALSFAAALILVFRPTALMEVGFLLSFYAVLGIFLFNNSFEKQGMKIVDRISPKRHFGKKFVKVCAISVATNLMTYPLVAYFFGEVPILFVLANFIILPYIMVVYIILLILILLSLITTFGGFVWIMKFLLVPFRSYIGLIGNLSFATIPIYVGITGIVVFTLVMLFVSRFVFLNRVQKVRGALTTVSVGLALSLLIAFL